MSMNHYTFFGDHLALEALTQHGDRLAELSKHIRWVPLVLVTEKIWRAGADKKAPCGAKPWDVEVIVQVLKRLNNLFDEQMEYQLLDRLSFLRFAGLGLGEAGPDSRAIWLYADQLAKADGARDPFEAFNRQLVGRGLLVKGGMMVDATFVEERNRRNSLEKNEKTKRGETLGEWLEQPRKFAQKNVDARWTKKNSQVDGYKDHITVGAKTKRIKACTVTAASTHDSQPMPGVIAAGDSAGHAGSAYTGETVATDLLAKGVHNCIYEKGTPAAELAEAQKLANHRKSKTRARGEHTFAFMEKSQGRIYNRCIGRLRNDHQVGMMSMCRNLCRCVQLVIGRAHCTA